MQAIIRQTVPHYHLPSNVSELLYFLPGINWRVLSVSSSCFLSSSKSRLLFYLPSLADFCPSPSLLHCVIPFHLPPTASDKVFKNGPETLDRAFRRFVAVPMHDVFEAMALTSLMHNALNSLFLQRVNKLFCDKLFLPVVDVVIPFVHRVFWRVFIMVHCNFLQWLQCSLFNWSSILGSIFLYHTFGQPSLDPLKGRFSKPLVCSIAQLQLTLWQRFRNWWAVKIEIFSGGNGQSCIARFSVSVFLLLSLRRFSSLIRIISRGCNSG